MLAEAAYQPARPSCWVNALLRASRWSSRSRWRTTPSAGAGCPAAVVEANGPEVAGEGDADAPGDGDDGVHADGAAGEQAADRLGDRGEGLVFGELAQPGRHAGGGDEPAGQERQQGEEHGGVAGGFHALGGHAQPGGQPDEAEAQKRLYPGGGWPFKWAGMGPEANGQGNTENEDENGEGLQQAADHVAGEHGAPRDGHGAEPVDDASGHVG